MDEETARARIAELESLLAAVMKERDRLAERLAFLAELTHELCDLATETSVIRRPGKWQA